MLYESTRGGIKSVLSADAIKRGIAPDGGLFVPETKVKFSLENIASLVGLRYQERALQIFRYFLDDYSDQEIKDCIDKAYTLEKFDVEDIAPLYKLNEHVSVLELWHGPTCAFKDMALQVLPHLLVKALKKTGEVNQIVILVATSGDTGKAALEGFKDVDGTHIIVFYPNNGVSEIQKMQMTTQEGSNVHSVAVEGNFDDAQNGVKAIFADKELMVDMEKNGYKFSSANSINWGRLLPQIVYYFSAYADMIERGEIELGQKINFVVPTGNFGNILSAYYAREMGLPINKLICASNDNNVLTDFINTGIYNRERPLIKTISPSMDILISSNLERLLFEITDHNAQQVSNWMSELNRTGSYSVDRETKRRISNLFWAEYADENETLKTIENIYKENDYVVDTHTAVGIDVYDKYVISTGDMSKAIIISTASPFKFNQSVAKALFGDENIEGKNEFELLDLLASECHLIIPEGLRGLDEKEILHKSVCDKSQMKDQVKTIFKLP